MSKASWMENSRWIELIIIPSSGECLDFCALELDELDLFLEATFSVVNSVKMEDKNLRQAVSTVRMGDLEIYIFFNYITFLSFILFLNLWDNRLALSTNVRLKDNRKLRKELNRFQDHGYWRRLKRMWLQVLANPALGYRTLLVLRIVLDYCCYRGQYYCIVNEHHITWSELYWWNSPNSFV